MNAPAIAGPGSRAQFTPKQIAVANNDAAQDLYFFARWMMLRRFGIKWLRANHHPVICDALTRVFRGETKRLILNLPPRYSKTFLVECFVAWTLGQAPDSEYIYTSYAATLAAKNSWETRELVSHEAYREIFPNVQLREDSQAREHWRTTAGGVVYASGAGGTITGFGAGKERPGFGGCILLDDPHKPDEATSEVTREGVLTWFQNTLESRRNSADTPIVLIMQRLHERDLAGWLLEGGNGEKWEHICCPAITDQGDALWPEKHSMTELERMRGANPYVFSGQYMQTPRPPGGAFFQEREFLVPDETDAETDPERMRYIPVPMPYGLTCVFAIIDTAVKTGKDHDGLAVVYCGVSRHHGIPLTVLDWDITQIEGAFLEAWLPNVFRRLEELAVNCKAIQGSVGALIEDKASGMVLLQQAHNRGWPAEAIDSKLTSLGKVERAVNVSGYIHSGQVKFCKEAYEKVATYKGSTRNHLLSQLLAFNPSVRDQGMDDLLDCMTYACAVALGNNAGF